MARRYNYSDPTKLENMRESVPGLVEYMVKCSGVIRTITKDKRYVAFAYDGQNYLARGQ